MHSRTVYTELKDLQTTPWDATHLVSASYTNICSTEKESLELEIQSSVPNYWGLFSGCAINIQYIHS